MFFRTPFLLPLLYPDLIWRIPTEKKEIYLTFDDGPMPGPTEFVLDQLKSYHAMATFFCIGDNIGKHPALFRRVLAEGHGLGNHTFNHLKGWSFSLRKYMDNVEQCKDRMIINGFQDTSSSRLFRPPYGRVKRSQIHALSNYKIIMWDVLTYDYSKISPEKCLRGSIRAIRPGSIVVMHDSLKAEKNMTYVLPRLLEHFSQLDFSFKTLNL